MLGVMNKNSLLILIIYLFLLSCQSKSEKLYGHWHEYSENNNDYNHCFIITDSTFSYDENTMGAIDKLTDLEHFGSPLEWVNYPQKLLTNMKIRKNEIIFGDSLIWKRQKNDLKTYISDFSVGLKLLIEPFETNIKTFDLAKTYVNSFFIYIGKVKKAYINELENINDNNFYIQLNDEISQLDRIFPFLLCNHCDFQEQRIFISADKNTPKEFLQMVEEEIIKEGVYNRGQIFYLTINTAEKIHGYNHYP